MNEQQNSNIAEGINRNLLPRHVAIIMDGNGRWAKRRGLPRSDGHAEGVNTVRRITRLSSDLGIDYLTLYAFSTENWNRPKEEVDTLMHLISWALEREIPELLANNVRMLIIGDLDRIPEGPRNVLLGCLEKTAHCTGLRLVLSLSYSSRWEITEAAKKIARRVAAGELSIDNIDETTISDSLATKGIPDPDILIRTGGEKRVSNYLLWQIAYSEFFFTDTLWPDFDGDEYRRILEEFAGRERRFGKTSEQVNPKSN